MINTKISVIILFFRGIAIEIIVAVEGAHRCVAGLFGKILFPRFGIFLFQFSHVGDALAVDELCKRHARLLVHHSGERGAVGAQLLSQFRQCQSRLQVEPFVVNPLQQLRIALLWNGLHRLFALFASDICKRKLLHEPAVAEQIEQTAEETCHCGKRYLQI